MTIHFHKYSDTNAPDLNAAPRGQGLFAMIYAILISGYGDHTGHGWEVIFDDCAYTTGSNGKLVIKHPIHPLYFVFKDLGNYEIETGMAEEAHSDGTLTGYQSGHLSQNGSRQGLSEDYTGSYEYWNGIYDDTSHTLIFISAASHASNLSDDNRNDSAVPTYYIGTLATVADISPVPFIGAGSIGRTSQRNSIQLFESKAENFTTLKKWDGSPADGSQSITIAAGTMNNHKNGTSGKGLVTILNSVWSKEAGRMIGRLRGILTVDDYKRENFSQFMSHYAPDLDANAEGAVADYEIPIGNRQCKIIPTEYRTTGLVVSLAPEDWEDL